MKLDNIIKKELKILKEEQMTENYMFFKNLKQIIRQCELLLELDENDVNEKLNNGHDWADDHITVAKEKLDDVFDFFMNEKNNEVTQLNEAKHKPTNPKLWAQCQSWARRTYKVHPSAYSNAAAVKRYNSKGGKWKTLKK
jgi:hypothetical protein